jgi:hypothetical protein
MQQGSLYNSYHKVYIVAVNYRAETEMTSVLVTLDTLLTQSLWFTLLHR